MNEKSNDKEDYELFVTEFPKKDYGIVDYLQGRVHFALLDQIKFMTASGMSQIQIKETILANVTEIVKKFDPKKSKSS
jgi:hypothetical protein